VNRSKVNAASAVACAAVLALIVAGCSSAAGKTSAPTSSSQPAAATTTTAVATTAQSGQLQVLAGTATGTSPCEQAAPTPASPGEVGGGAGGSTSDVSVLVAEHGPRGMVKQLPLTHAQRMELQVQMEQARAAAARYPTVASALAGGYRQSTVYVPCIGAHYTNVGLAGSFNPAAPAELLYDGTTPDSKIVGLSYLVYHPGGPPTGFAGPNGHWHQHNANGGLCMRGDFVVGGEIDTPAQCAAAGGHKALLLDVWMLHAWVVPGFECSWGVFNGECPELGGRLGGNAWESPSPTAASSSAASNG